MNDVDGLCCACIRAESALITLKQRFLSLNKGIIVSVTRAGTDLPAQWKQALGAAGGGPDVEIDVEGAFVTPGLVDMHSHHLMNSWPALPITEDGNEVHPDTGPLSPQVRILDSLAAYDVAAALIASGGVTSSLVIPG